MGETSTGTGSEKTIKKSFFKGLQTEFKKIIFPDQETLTKQTIAVLECSIALGAVIAVLDTVIKYGINFVLGLV